MMVAQGTLSEVHVIGTGKYYRTPACTQAALFSVMGYSIADQTK